MDSVSKQKVAAPLPMQLDSCFGGNLMVGPLPAGRKWTSDEERQLLEMLASGIKAPVIARRLKRSTGAVYARINELKKTWEAPAERLVAARSSASSYRTKWQHDTSKRRSLFLKAPVI